MCETSAITLPGAKNYNLCDSRTIGHTVEYMIKMNLY